MSEPPASTILRLPQDRETSVFTTERLHLGYSCAYARSADTIKGGDVGQDYLLLAESEQRIVFALCDGVSQSFMGDLASTMLGEALIAWLWNELPQLLTPSTVSMSLRTLLSNLTIATSERVNNFPLSSDLQPFVLDVLEQKRGHGSESTFVCGSIDVMKGQLWLFWMGDSRIRLYGLQGERTRELGETFHTKERWSSRVGPVGITHAFLAPLQNISSVVLYSDGLASLDNHKGGRLSDEEVKASILTAGEKPASDDVSFLEIRLQPSFEIEAHAVATAPVQMEFDLRKEENNPSLTPTPPAPNDGRTPTPGVALPSLPTQPTQMRPNMLFISVACVVLIALGLFVAFALVSGGPYLPRNAPPALSASATVSNSTIISTRTPTPTPTRRVTATVTPTTAFSATPPVSATPTIVINTSTATPTASELSLQPSPVVTMTLSKGTPLPSATYSPVVPPR